MILIAHRGNMTGSNIQRENEPLYIIEALEKSFDVEVDVWWKDDGFWLGHDEPQYQVKEEFLQNIKLWCHAKNIDALNQMIENGKIHCFFHQEDDVTLTSKGYLWTYPGKQLTSNSIAVLPEGNVPDGIAGICSDNVGSYKVVK